MRASRRSDAVRTSWLAARKVSRLAEATSAPKPRSRAAQIGARNRWAAEKFGVLGSDWAPECFPSLLIPSSANSPISHLILTLTVLLRASNYGPAQAERKGRRRQGVHDPLRGGQEAAMFLSGLPKVMHSEGLVCSPTAHPGRRLNHPLHRHLPSGTSQP